MTQQFRIVDFFCGMGNFRAGFEKAGAVSVFSVEYDKNKREIYKIIYGKEPDAGDIRTVHARDIPDAECWCFGAPCTSFSLAGLRKGMDGESGLIREIFRLLRDKEPCDRPKFLVYENVKGMLSSNHGWDFAFILAEMADLGYDTEYSCLNSKNFGVPQNRERIFTIGWKRDAFRYFGDGCRPKVFPLTDSDKSVSQLQGYEDRGLDAPIGKQDAICEYDRRQEHSPREQRGISDNGWQADTSERLSPQVKQIAMMQSHRNNPNQYRVYDVSGIAPCLNKAEGGGRTPYILLDDNRTQD